MYKEELGETLIFRGEPEGEEGGTMWQHCKMFTAKLLSSHFDLDDADIERAHRSPTVRDSSRSVTKTNHGCLLNMGASK